MAESCPVCLMTLRNIAAREDGDYIECVRCGAFLLAAGARVHLAKELDDRTRARISHIICKMTRPGHWARISPETLRSLIANDTESPTPAEQLDNLVACLGRVQPHPGSKVDYSPRLIAAAGAVDLGGLGFIVSEAVDRGLINCRVQEVQALSQESLQFIISPMQLTIAGWNHFESLERGRVASRIAFMAMNFGDAALDSIYREHFRPAVAQTGFRLKRLDEDQPAGLIDDRLRVEIRQSRFLISDLTHKNPGAYWEAGYAEGLGKPVIYTCRRDVFDDKNTGPHFDTNHHLIVIWNRADPQEAVTKLKATIRATLPGECAMADSV